MNRSPLVVTYDFDDTLFTPSGKPIAYMHERLRADARHAKCYIVSARSRRTDKLAPLSVADAVRQYDLPVTGVYLTGSDRAKVIRAVGLQSTLHYDDLPDVNAAMADHGVVTITPIRAARRNGGDPSADDVDRAALSAARQHNPALTAITIVRKRQGPDFWVVEVHGRTRTANGGSLVHRMLLEVKSRGESPRENAGVRLGHARRSRANASGVDLDDVDVQVLWAALSVRDRERLRAAWAQLDHHEREAETAETHGLHERATTHWERAAEIGDWLEGFLAEALEARDTTAGSEVDYEPEHVHEHGEDLQERLLRLALRVYEPTVAYSPFELSTVARDRDHFRRTAARSLEAYVQELRGSLAADLLETPDGRLWRRTTLPYDDPCRPVDSTRRGTLFGGQPGPDVYDVWVPYRGLTGGRPDPQGCADHVGPETLAQRRAMPFEPMLIIAQRIGDAVRAIAVEVGADPGQIKDVDAVVLVTDLYNTRVRRRAKMGKQRPPRENAGVRRPTAKIEAAVAAMQVYLGSIAKVRPKDEDKLYARAMKAVEAVAKHYGTQSIIIWSQIEVEARSRGLRLARPGQDI